MVHLSGLDYDELAFLVADIERLEVEHVSVTGVELDPGPAVSLPLAKRAQPRKKVS